VAKHSPNQSLADSLERIERVESIVNPCGFDAVRGDSTLTDALLHNLLIASEAITRLRNEWPERYAALEAAYPDAGWHAFRRFGDVLRHAYGDIDMAIVETNIESWSRRSRALSNRSLHCRASCCLLTTSFSSTARE
jgi:uncharacterized protein with HEPN domain